MQYKLETTINKPINEVVKLFDSVDNLYKWMEGLEKFEHISGKPGEVGAKSRLTFQMGKRKMVMIETIQKKDLPREFTGSYEAKGVYNIVRNKFEKISENQTKYINENEFMFDSFFMKLFGIIAPGLFKKQSMKYLNDFKKFAEEA